MTHVELIRHYDQYQDPELGNVSQIAADALVAAGIKGAFSVVVDMGIPQRFVIGGTEAMYHTTDTHMPASVVEGLQVPDELPMAEKPAPDAVVIATIQGYKDQIARLEMSESQAEKALTQLNDLYVEKGCGVSKEIVHRKEVVLEHAAGWLFLPLADVRAVNFRRA